MGESVEIQVVRLESMYTMVGTPLPPGASGLAVLTERKAMPDGAAVPVIVTASEE